MQISRGGCAGFARDGSYSLTTHNGRREGLDQRFARVSRSALVVEGPNMRATPSPLAPAASAP